MLAMICQPVDRVKDSTYIETKHKAISQLQNLGYDILTQPLDEKFSDASAATVDNQNIAVQNRAVYYLGKFIQATSGCDALYFTLGWDKDPICSLKHQIAKACGINILYENSKFQIEK